MINSCYIHKIIIGVGISLVFYTQLFSQLNLDKRPDEKTVLLEKLFIDAMREKILGNYEAAIARYQEVVQKDQYNHVAIYQLADLYNTLEQYDKAIVRIEHAVKLAKTNLVYVDFYATLLSKIGGNKEAANLYASLSKHYPKQEYIYYEWAFYLNKANQKKQAIKVYNRLEKIIGLQPKLSTQKSRLYSSMQKTKKAAKELEILVNAFPKEVSHVILLAEYYKRIGRNEDAHKYYEQALLLDPHHPQANIAMAEVFRQEGDTLKYVRALQSVFEDEQQPPLAKVKVLEPLVQQAIEQNKQKQQVQQLAQILTTVHPNYSKAHTLYGHLLSADKKYILALEEYEQVLGQDKNQIEVWKQLLKIYSILYRNQALLNTATTFVELYPSQAVGHYYLGLAYLRKTDLEKAVSALKRASNIAVDNLELQAYCQAALGEALSQQKAFDKADIAFDEAMSLSPSNLDIQHSYSKSLLDRIEKLSDAERIVKRLRKKDPTNIEYQITEAWLLYRKANYTASARAFEKLMDQGEERNAMLVEKYGDCLFKLKNVEKALVQWQLAKDLGNNSTILERKIETKQLYE